MNAEHRLSILIGKGAFCLLEIDPAAGVKWAWCLRLVAPGRCALLPAVGGPGGPALPCGTRDALATALLPQTVVLGKVSLLPQKRGGGERAGGSPGLQLRAGGEEEGRGGGGCLAYRALF